MPLNIIRNDITKVSADAIVNTANPDVAFGAGVDRAIYEAAGEKQLLAERAKIGPMEPGQAAYTPAFDLDAKYIIHTVGPAWMGGDFGEREAVASCYKESLRIADELKCESIAFPLISTGTYGFPKDEALQIAVREISSFLFEHDMDVYMVVYDKESFVISGKAFPDIRTYIEERDVRPTTVRESRISARRERIRRRPSSALISKEDVCENTFIQEQFSPAPEEAEEELPMADMGVMDAEEDEAPVAASYSIDLDYIRDTAILGGRLEEIIKGRSETFQEMLFRLIDRKGLQDPDVYHKANISRKLFSKIRSNVYYSPSKKTAIAFAIALELNLDETLDLIGKAGFTLSDASVFDLIIKYCIIHKIYNIFEINNYLFKYTDEVLAV